jgi:hypothetical protein
VGSSEHDNGPRGSTGHGRGTARDILMLREDRRRTGNRPTRSLWLFGPKVGDKIKVQSIPDTEMLLAIRMFPTGNRASIVQPIVKTLYAGMIVKMISNLTAEMQC